MKKKLTGGSNSPKNLRSHNNLQQPNNKQNTNSQTTNNNNNNNIFYNSRNTIDYTHENKNKKRTTNELNAYITQSNDCSYNTLSQLSASRYVGLNNPGHNFPNINTYDDVDEIIKKPGFFNGFFNYFR